MEAGLHNLPKHVKYKDTYRPYGYFWGLGVEHETYMQSAKTREVRSFDGAMAPERYSVSYYKAYKPDILTAALKTVTPLTAPILLNAYAMTNTDVFGEHSTLYVRGSPQNPKYCGKTLFEWMQEHSPWLASEYDRSFVWDGDTVEFITQDFYNATVDHVMGELAYVEHRFAEEIAKMPRRGIFDLYGPFRLVERNEPWAVYTTNPNNVAMFNNGTIHVNVTLPTRLGWNCQPLWPSQFVEQHRRLARLIQWVEPLWVALYGAPDPFTHYDELRDSFAAGSQRLAVSRYIGLGTFDTDTMPTGKILQIPKLSYPWYDRLHEKTAYVPLDTIGLDLNFNKHWAHGLEIRIFDQMDPKQLYELLKQVVALMDASLTMTDVEKPQLSTAWQEMATEAMYRGASMSFEPTWLNALWSAFDLAFESKGPLTPEETMRTLMELLETRLGPCWEHMVEGHPASFCEELLEKISSLL